MLAKAQCLLSYRLLCVDVKAEMPNSVISAVVSAGCENWPLTLREDQRLKIL